MNITVSTGFSKPRIETFYKFHMMKMDKMRYLFYGGIIALLIITILFSTVFENYKNSVTIVVMSILGNLILIGTRPYRIYVGFKKAIKQTPPSDKTYTVTFNDEGVSYKMDYQEELYKWESVLTIREIIDVFYVYVSDTKAIIVPKYLIEREEREKLVEFFKGKTLFKKHKFGQVKED